MRARECTRPKRCMLGFHENWSRPRDSTAFYLNPIENINSKWAYHELMRCDINGMDSGSAIPSTSRDDFYRIPVTVPPLAVQAAFGDIVAEWMARISMNARLNRDILDLRTILLPRILTGFTFDKAARAIK